MLNLTVWEPTLQPHTAWYVKVLAIGPDNVCRRHTTYSEHIGGKSLLVVALEAEDPFQRAHGHFFTLGAIACTLRNVAS